MIRDHAGGPVRVKAEQCARPISLRRADRPSGEERRRLGQAERGGTQSAPALMIDEHPIHINLGASLADLN
jgi:hypothetical protein